jgi:mercuric ion transport protein
VAKGKRIKTKNNHFATMLQNDYFCRKLPMKPLSCLLSTVLLASLAHSLCCITPLLLMLTGLHGMALSFHWLDAYKPYVLAIQLLTLGWAFYRVYGVKKHTCVCNGDTATHTQSIQKRQQIAVWMVAAISLLLSAFTLASEIERKQERPGRERVQRILNTRQLVLKIHSASTGEIEGYVRTIPGVTCVETADQTGISIVKYNRTQTTRQEVIKAIQATGCQAYKLKAD